MDTNEFSLAVRVYLEDTDAQGVVYNASYFRFMERARTDWLRNRGIDHSELAEQHGAALVLTSISAKFLAPVRLGELIDVSARVTDVRGARVTFAQEIRVADDEGGRPVCTGIAEVACKSIETGRPLRWPNELLRELKE